MKEKMLKVIFALVGMLLLLSGCINTSTSLPPTDQSLPPVSGFADDIQDIILPGEMEWDREKSMTIKTESFRGGIWRYVGKVETISLKDFMVSSMQDNNWKLVGEAASSDIMLAFVKPNKTCMMVISEANYRKTGLTLYVTIDKTAAVGLNPFGEAITE